jgi:aldose 1-epimerase
LRGKYFTATDTFISKKTVHAIPGQVSALSDYFSKHPSDLSMSPQKSLLQKSTRTLAATLLASSICLPAQAAQTASVSVKPFGKTDDGQKVELYILTNKNGLKVSLATYGATVVNLYAPDRSGKLADIALGFGTLKPYLTKSPYFGAIVGRYGNRIAKGKFTLDGKTYKLATNNGVNHLHGGLKGFDKRVWTASVPKSAQASVTFTLRSADGEEGYPGNLVLSVTYTLTDKNELRISYRAQTDKPTALNPTHHTYFNLAGAGNGNVLNHELKLHADRFTPVNKTLIPTGELKKVDGTVMDFRKATSIGARIRQVGGKPVGYDHNYVLNKCPVTGRCLAAEVYEPKSGRVMKVYTDQPGIQFYSGNFLDGTITGKGGKIYKQYSGFCLETQHFPDSPNQPKFPSTVLRPGETFRTTTVYQFSAK